MRLVSEPGYASVESLAILYLSEKKLLKFHGWPKSGIEPVEVCLQQSKRRKIVD